MRRRLVLSAVALATTIVLAFCIPLARLVHDIARDQAIATAERDAERVIGALSITVDRDAVEPVIESTTAGGQGRLGVVFADGTSVGTALGGWALVELGRSSSVAFTAQAGNAIVLVAPIELGDGVAVVTVLVPNEQADRGVASAWVMLFAVAVVLLVVGVVVADRFARSVTEPATALAEAAGRIADGDLSVRVPPTGPPELARAASGFNDLAGRLGDLVARERQEVADLAHRLRTPLSALRLDVEGVEDDDVRSRLADDTTELEQAVDLVIREARHPLRRAVTPTSDLVAVARDRVAFWSALAEEQGRAWDAELPETELVVGVPHQELEAVVDALLDNVFTHTPPGTGFAVHVRAVGERDAQLVVSDHGPGFGAGHSSRVQPGRTGLGLDIAERAAAAAGGTLVRRNDHGAVVTLELPIRTDAPVPPADRRRHRVRERSFG